jgi:CMP-N-acetylneuraminic acid synthetase
MNKNNIMEKTICLIAARGGSKGVPGKNIRSMGNKPLIVHTIESAIKSKLFTNVIVTTDDKKIAKIAKQYGAEVPFLRPKKLGTDTVDYNKVIMHAIIKLKSLGYEFDILVNRDCTVPFIKNQDMKKAIKLFKKENCDLVCAVYRQHHNPYFNMMEVDSKGYLKFSKKMKNRYQGRQNAPIVYQLNGLFVINVNQFLKYKKIYMPKVIPFEIPPETGHMIDTEFEFQIADCVAKNIIKLD